MTPVAFTACRQLLPSLYQQDTSIAYLTRAALMELKTVHEVIFIFFTVSEPWAETKKMHVSNSHHTAQLSGATSGQLIYHTNIAYSLSPPKYKAKYQWEVTNDNCQIKRGPCTNTMLLRLWAQNMKTVISWDLTSYHLWICASKVPVCVGDLVVHISSKQIYRVSQEERSIFWEVIVSVILSKRLYMNMCPIPNGFRDRAIWLYSGLAWAPSIVLPSCPAAPLSEACESVEFSNIYYKLYQLCHLYNKYQY